jgi:uncharacterized protein (TIGR03118 family)
MYSLSGVIKAIFTVLAILAIITGCKKSSSNNMERSYLQVNLVADKAGYGAARIDPVLANPWGIAIGGTGAFWISANHTGSTTIYDRTGAQLLPAVAIPSGGALNGGSPTGVVFNATTADFVIASNGQKSRFIYAGEDGTISAWSSGTATITVADRSSSGSVYKGMAIGADGGASFLYLADFKGAKVDVFDNHFNYITSKPFSDPGIPSGYAPFNIQNIGGMLYVAYAKQLAPDNKDDEKGAGHGFINIFTPAGTLVKRFASQGTLNSPWAITTAPDGFGQGSNVILVGNFGDGRINVFNADGTYKSQLTYNGSPIAIDGLWALNFPQNNIPAGDPNQLFFTAGPDDEKHGIFGYIAPQ